MSSGFTFGGGNLSQPTSFGNVLGATSTTASNPLGSTTLFSGLAAPTTTSTFQFGGVASTPSMFSTSSLPLSTSSWLSQPPASSTAQSLFSGTNTTAATGTTPSTGLLSSFGATPSLGLSVPSVGLSAVPTATFGVQPTALSVPSLNFAAPVAPTASVTSGNSSIGLGGVDYSKLSADSGGVSTSGKSDSKVLKETVLPDLIKADVDSFRNHVKHQKAIREEISRISSKPLFRVQEETVSLKQLLSVASSGVQRNAVAIEKLKAESASELKNAEIAQRTKDFPPSMQYENTAPTNYFQEMVVSFERQMQVYRKQIEDLEHHRASLSQSSALMPHELNVIIRRLHETFVALAAQLQLVHETVQTMKEDFTHFCRNTLGDTRNIFEAGKVTKNLNSNSVVSIAMGPTPFSSVPNTAAVAMLTALNRTQQPAGVSSTLATAGNSQLSTLGNTSLMSGVSFNRQPAPLGNFGISSSFKPLGQTSAFNQPFLTTSNPSLGENPYGVQNNSTFQLQKPPLGNKRGKRWTSS